MNLPESLVYLADQLMDFAEDLDDEMMPKIGGVAIALQVLAKDYESAHTEVPDA
jgi:hypothetical protein